MFFLWSNCLTPHQLESGNCNSVSVTWPYSGLSWHGSIKSKYVFTVSTQMYNINKNSQISTDTKVINILQQNKSIKFRHKTRHKIFIAFAHLSMIWHTALVRRSMLLWSKPSMFHVITRMRCGSESILSAPAACALLSAMEDVPSSEATDAK